jgi:DNA-binding response OmpR family regulator
MLAAPVGKARILVVDDEAGVRKFFRLALEQAGYEVTEAENGRQALDQALAGRVDLLITDLVMPEKEGIETIRALRREAPGIGIIAVSGAFGGMFLSHARMLGADAVLGKPVGANLLLAKVAEVLEARRL